MSFATPPDGRRMPLSTVRGEEYTVRNTRSTLEAAPRRFRGLTWVLENRLMNRRLCVWVVFFLAGVRSPAGSPSLFAQALPSSPPVLTSTTAGIPADAQSNAVESAADVLAINGFVQAQLNALTGADPAAQAVARKALVNQLGRGATPAYYTAFSQAWVKSATAALAKSPPVSVRLNIAIVTSILTDNGMVLAPSRWSYRSLTTKSRASRSGESRPPVR